jgi:hypothetical protein
MSSGKPEFKHATWGWRSCGGRYRLLVQRKDCGLSELAVIVRFPAGKDSFPFCVTSRVPLGPTLSASYSGVLSRWKKGLKLTSHLHLVPRLRMLGVAPPGLQLRVVLFSSVGMLPLYSKFIHFSQQVTWQWFRRHIYCASHNTGRDCDHLIVISVCQLHEYFSWRNQIIAWNFHLSCTHARIAFLPTLMRNDCEKCGLLKEDATFACQQGDGEVGFLQWSHYWLLFFRNYNMPQTSLLLSIRH